MSNAAVSSSWPIGAILATVLVVAACSSGSPAASMAEAPGTVVPASPGRADPFAGLPYRMDLPTDWAVRGTPAYDGAIDASPDVATWLKGLDLEGQNAFRAYEPLPGATGLRVAIKALQTGNPSPLQEEGAIAALPGVTGGSPATCWRPDATGRPSGIGGTRRWTGATDLASARTCIGYFVMVDNPVNVVFCYTAATDRAREVDALVSTFVVLGNPVFSLPRARRRRLRQRRTTSSRPRIRRRSPTPTPRWRSSSRTPWVGAP